MAIRLKSLIGEQPERITELRNTRRAERDAFLIALREPSLAHLLENDVVFAELVDLAITEYGVRQLGLADTLGISTAAVGRWRAGKNAPPVYGRVHIIGVVGDILEADLEINDNAGPP